MKKLLSFIFLLSFLLFASQVQAIPPMPPSGGCTTFSCLAGIPTTIAGYGLTGVVQPYDATILNAAAIGVSVQGYNSYLTGINQNVSTAGSPTWVGATVGAGGITATKQNGVAGLITVYNATTTSTLYSGFMGMASQTESFVYQLPAEPTVAGYVWSMGVPTGGGDPNGNKVSTITPVYPALSSVGAQVTLATGGSTARTITVDDAAQTMARRDAGQTFTGVDNFTSPVLTTPELIGEQYDVVTQSPQSTGTVTIAPTTTGKAIITPGGATQTDTIVFSPMSTASKVRYVRIQIITDASHIVTVVWPASNVSWISGTSGQLTALTASKRYEYVCEIESVNTYCMILAEGVTP
jgi:hypothetical protein